ncbi:MarR family transcriptional regulator [Alsobacter sp. SYSU M60028]|uniref:MarR family transcriptional regulator n=1 Tax=Alsobacter ponti TaxID=2962936 RepID=A0ABT1L6D7_9HYPH|nr:MarR family transcriptional regulator [Alsobacter ponti]MCP8936957.1 MarR family transcriptional regulator [Alsobacter ponti]
MVKIAGSREAASGQGAGRRAAALALDEFLPYRLNVLAQIVAEGLEREYSAAFGIHIPEWRILAALGEQREMTARDIGRHSRMHKTKVSRAVAHLLDRGLLDRRANETDRREAFLKLSPEGRAIYEAIVPMAKAYEARLTEGLSRQDLAAVDRVLRLILRRVGTPSREPRDTGA